MEKIWIKKELYILNYEFMKFYAFFWLFIWFLFILFFTKISKKGITYLQMLTWRAGPTASWHVERGTIHGYDVALRPHGRAMAGPRESQVALTRGRRPWGWVHADAREGRHVA